MRQGLPIAAEGPDAAAELIKKLREFLFGIQPFGFTNIADSPPQPQYRPLEPVPVVEPPAEEPPSERGPIEPERTNREIICATLAHA